ncbi:MAG: hypothetical protein NTX54_05740 [Chloroflexi bacterium]|nr:hypothetical protein [Chloroflexota bacterium]
MLAERIEVIGHHEPACIALRLFGVGPAMRLPEHTDRTVGHRSPSGSSSQRALVWTIQIDQAPTYRTTPARRIATRSPSRVSVLR